MTRTIGIRREDKNRWEARVPLTPAAVARLVREEGIRVVVQPSSIRIFSDDEYRDAGAIVQEDISRCQPVFAVKEIPQDLLRRDGSYVFFSHTTKGQPYNMGMLGKLVDLSCSVLDYEHVVTGKGQRLIFFSWYAGVAGMVDTLAALAGRLCQSGTTSPFAGIRYTHEYDGLGGVAEAMDACSERIRGEGLPPALAPFVVGIAGYGRVSSGVQHVLDQLPVEEVPPGDLAALTSSKEPPRDRIFKVVFHEEHMVEPMDPRKSFDLQEYYHHPERFRSVFHRHVPHLSLLINAIFWTERYPRLLSLDFLREHFRGSDPRLLVVGDISCDIGGAVECTVKSTNLDEPTFVYDPISGSVNDGLQGPGLLVMAVDNLPCELPREASRAFSEALLPFVPRLARANWSGAREDLHLPDAFARALVMHRGVFTPSYRYMNDFLKE